MAYDDTLVAHYLWKKTLKHLKFDIIDDLLKKY